MHIRDHLLDEKLARKILYSHQRRRHPRDPNNNPEEGIYDVSDGVVKKKVPMDHVEDHANDDPENVPDTNSTGDSEDDSCVEILGDEEWGSHEGGRRYD